MRETVRQVHDCQSKHTTLLHYRQSVQKLCPSETQAKFHYGRLVIFLAISLTVRLAIRLAVSLATPSISLFG